MFKKVSPYKHLLLLILLAISISHIQAATAKSDWQICYSQPDGTVFPIEGSCNTYIYCLGQYPYTLDCANDMGFNKAARGCVKKRDSDCEELGNDEAVKAATITTNNTNLVSTTIRPAAAATQTTIRTCVDNEKRTENQAACAGQAFGASVPYPGNCAKFLVCMCEYPTVKDCPEGLWWDNNYKVCNYPQAVNCDNSTGGTTLPMDTSTTPISITTTDSSEWGNDCKAPEGMSDDICLKYDNGFLIRYPYNCNAYINCTMGCPVMNYCQADKVFNGFLKICDTPDTAQCEELPLPATTTTEEPSTTSTEEPEITTTEESTSTPEINTPPGECIPPFGISTAICADQYQDSFVPYPYNCTGYIVCQWQCPFLEYCEPGKVFNALFGICDTPEGVICEELPLPTTTEAPTTTPSSETTTDITITTSTEEPITTTSLPSDINPNLCLNELNYTLLPYEADCSKYLQCVDGEVELKSCPQDWLFNSELLICDQNSQDKCYTGVTTTEESSTITTETTPIFELCLGEPENKTFPYTEDCSWYYYCRGNDLYYLLPCPNNNYYDPYSGNCGPAVSPIECQEPVTTTTTTTTVATTLSPSQKCANQAIGTTYTYEENCQQYVFCDGKGGYSILRCPNNNYYYPDSGDCGPSEDPQICFEGSTTTPATTQKLTTTTSSTTIAPPTTNSPVLPTQGICGNSSNGELIEYPNNCQKYISCVKPIPIAFYCNTNWYFDEEQQKCVPDSQGSCSGLPTNNTTTTTTGQPPINNICQGLKEGDWQIYPQDCKLYYECLGDGYYMLQICSENEYFNPILGECSSQVGSEYCKQNFDTTLPPTTTEATTNIPKPSGICDDSSSGSKIPYPDNCFKYIVCQNPIPVGYQCSEGLQFSSDKQECVEPIDSDCGVIPITTTTPESTPTKPYNQCTNKPDFTLLPYEEDCALFIVCRNGSELLGYCEEDQYFDVWQGKCGKGASEDGCRKQQTTTTESTTNSTTESTTILTTTTDSTTISTTQDPNLGPCYNKPNGTKLPYSNNCDKYIECQDPIPVGHDCPEGLEFSEFFGECVTAKLANCSIKTTTATQTTTEYTTPTTPQTKETCENKPNGSTLPYPSDCSSYYVCIDGGPKLTRCMPNTYYDPSSGMCDDDISATACQEIAVTTTTESTTITTSATTIPQETEEPCAGQANGYTYPYPKDCSKYYMCLQGTAHIVKCGQNSYYNLLMGECDAALSNTECQETDTTTPNTTTTENTTTPIPTTTEETTITTPTEEPQSDNICCGQKSGTRLAYPGDSTKYVTCQYPLPIVEQCPQDSQYDASTASCLIVKNYTTTYAKPECSEVNFGKVMAYNGDCSKYYFCFGTDAMVIQCSENWYFSDILNQCVPKDLYKCPW